MWISRAKYKKLLGDIEGLNSRLELLEKEINEDVRSLTTGLFFESTFDVPTISGQVDALMNHLGLEANVRRASKKTVIVKPKKVKK